jgi:hypothetical protein
MRCHCCQNHVSSHADDCRAPSDLMRLSRVYARLSADGRDPQVREKIGYYLRYYGLMAEA